MRQWGIALIAAMLVACAQEVPQEPVAEEVGEIQSDWGACAGNCNLWYSNDWGVCYEFFWRPCNSNSSCGREDEDRWNGCYNRADLRFRRCYSDCNFNFHTP